MRVPSKPNKKNLLMKRSLFLILFSVFCFLSSHLLRADEGMWIPLLLKQLNESDMQAKGLKLSAEDLYSINKSSLKDAIVHFGGGCTGEIISGEGLMLTNHHCGYGQIQNHSSVEKDYLTNGFWAMNKNEELSNPGLTATLIVRIEDVTNMVLKGVRDDMSERVRDSVINVNIKYIEKDAVKGTHYEARIRPFYNGNEYYMFITETFKDVRLVGAPPSSIGKFGGDTDNWMWPRHTGDFSIFRIYADKDNKPADYSKDNVPYKPKHFFPISLKGVKENDFTMVYGFPGRTNEYLPSYAVDLIVNISNPAKIKVRDERLAIWDAEMKKNDTIRIQYAAKYASVANAWKKWIGESKGVKRFNGVQKKEEQEKEFTKRIQANQEWNIKYAGLLDKFKVSYNELAYYTSPNDYFIEAIMAIESFSLARGAMPLIDLSTKQPLNNEEIKKQTEKMLSGSEGFFKNYNSNTDKKIFAAMLELYIRNVDKAFYPSIISDLQKKYKLDFNKIADEVYAKSIFTDKKRYTDFMTSYDAKKIKKISSDPVYVIFESFWKLYINQIAPNVQRINTELALLQRTYMKALREVMPEKRYYPDANSTLRVAYGKVEGYEPMDAVKYNYYTSLDGIIEKEDPKNDEFIVPEKLKTLFKNKDYGQYGVNGTLPVAFVASNHTTGGNSGSPVLDAEGNLIGTNFDRVWEGTMSDIMFDPDRCRNISVDVRYTLFIVDKFAGAGYLLNEMRLIK
jgi:hypothetical protein